MSSKYYYQRQGQKFGPVSSRRLRELAVAGELTPDDLLRREDMSDWERAAKFKGLFAPAEGEPVPVAMPAAAAPTAPPAASNAPTPTAPPAGATRKLSEWSARLRPLAERYAVEFALGTRQFVAAAAGAVCLLFLVLSTFLTWDVYEVQMGEALRGMNDSKSTAGLEVPEGKLVCLLSVVGMGLTATTFFVRRLLPLTLLVAGAAATCSLLLTFSFKHRLNHFNDEMARETKAMARNMGTMFGKEEGKQAMAMLAPTETESAGLGLYLAMLTSLIAAPALVFAALSKPVPVPFLQKDSIHPFARQHGALLIAQAAAVLVGLTVYIVRY